MLIAQGHRVVGIDNFNTYYDIRLKLWRAEELKKRDSFQLVEGDIENLGLLNYLFSNHHFDAVVNLAARAGVRYSMENPHVYLNSNADGTLNLLECMRKSDIKKLVLASTSSLYAGQEMPFLETLPVNQPISPYAASKKAAEVMSYTYHHLYGFDVSILRYFTVYGPAGRPDMSPLRFIKWIDEGTPITLYGDGSQSRDFTYVDDIARGTISALIDADYEIINLGGGNNPVSISRMITTFEELLGKKAVIDHQPFNKSDMMHTWANIDKAKKLLDWEPQIDFETGMQKTVEWYLENKNWISKLDV
ncbi:NAD dependent epimerase/dehydratase family [Verrucomicrobiia bacterium DG1235]|nr:NAD dependent epimerase/dehydratase family [Verrucomicrobiae bacterium DG1235]